MNRRNFIDVVSTLFSQRRNNVEKCTSTQLSFSTKYQPWNNVDERWRSTLFQCWFNVDVFAGYWGAFLKEQLSSVMLRKRDEVSFKSHSWAFTTQQTIIYSKSNSRNTRKKCEICSKLTIKTPEGRHWRRRSCVFIGNFKHIS